MAPPSSPSTPGPATAPPPLEVAGSGSELSPQSSSRPIPQRARPSARIFVTGIGLSTGLGVDRESTWRGLREGRSAACWLEELGDRGGRPVMGCPIVRSGAADDEPVLTLLQRVADEAMADARLARGGFDPDRVATLIGLSKGGIKSLGAAFDRLRSTELAHSDKEIARLWGQSWPSAGASRVAARFGFRGPCLAPVAACATGLVAVLRATELLRSGRCDVAIAGSADASLEPLLLGAFRRMRVLALGADDPRQAIRPWDRKRSGFLVGEGGAVLVLEREEHARARGARPIAEIAGGVLASDAYHETDLNPDPRGLADLIGRTLERSGVAADEIDHVNVHGTATRPNDPIECQALRLALGAHADHVSCSASKSQIGHLLGAAGSAELAIACLAIRDGFVPPTLNLDDPDPACDLDGTPHVGKARPIRAALKLSIGFGGHLAAAVLRRVEEPPNAAVADG